MTKVPQGFDFSFLNEEEARKILQVLERNEELRRAEKDRIRYEANSSSWAGLASCWLPREPRDTCWDPAQVLLGAGKGNRHSFRVSRCLPGVSPRLSIRSDVGCESRTPQGGGRKVAHYLHFSVRGSPPVGDTWANLSWEGFRHSRASGAS